MSLNVPLLSEFDQETASLRKRLERAPEKDYVWRPHPKSMSFVGVCSHLANLLTWTKLVIEQDALDVAPGGVPLKPDVAARSSAELPESFDRNRAGARASLAAADDARLLAPWSFQNHGKTLFTLPRVAALRSFVFNHLVHHRGQLTVYLRLRDVPPCAVYGPSADEAT
jgi:uncharacterized damage-inducible protein DinB